MVDIKPDLNPKLSFKTFTIGATQFVVHDAFERILCSSGMYSDSFTPNTIVISSFFAGDDMITFFAPPFICPIVSFADLNLPEDSITISTFVDFQSISSGFECELHFIVLPSTIMLSSSKSMFLSKIPYMLSYFNK